MSASPLIRVLVVDDSAFNRRAISEVLETSGMARVIAVARDGEEGIKKAFDSKPDLITLDLEMPRMDGFTFLRIIMKSLPTPILVISSRSEDKNVFKALELGAIDFLAKPRNHLETGPALREQIIEKLKVVRELRFRNVQRRLSRMEAPSPPTVAEPAPVVERAEAAQAVVIGASTGGPSALQSVICSLPSDFPSAILVSQHMPAGFTRAFSERLDKNSGLRIKEASQGDPVTPGSVLIAPGGKNLSVTRNRGKPVASVEDWRQGDKYVPSINKLFSSAAEVFAHKCMGVVLTGMGNDGAKGVAKIKDAGGYVIAESEKTAIVFGMPKEAIATNRVDEVLNLEDIPVAILKRCRIK